MARRCVCTGGDGKSLLFSFTFALHLRAGPTYQCHTTVPQHDTPRNTPRDNDTHGMTPREDDSQCDSHRATHRATTHRATPRNDIRHKHGARTTHGATHGASTARGRHTTRLTRRDTRRDNNTTSHTAVAQQVAARPWRQHDGDTVSSAVGVTVLAPSFGHPPSVGHPELLTHFLFNCYQTSYTASSTLCLHIYQLFLTKNTLCSEIKKRLFVTLVSRFPKRSSEIFTVT